MVTYRVGDTPPHFEGQIDIFDQMPEPEPAPPHCERVDLAGRQCHRSAHVDWCCDFTAPGGSNA